MKKICFILLVTLLVTGVIPFSHVLAAPDDITMEAEVGFDGNFKLTNWIPVRVYIENRGEDIKGNIEIIGNQDESTAMLFTAPAVIPKGSKKRIDLYVRISTLQKNMTIDLTSKGKVLKTIEVGNLIPMPVTNFMLGVLSDDRSGLNYWWEKQSGDRLFTRYEAIALDGEDIPTKKEVMDNFAMVVMDDFDMGELSSDQRDVILEWVNGGGILVIGTGSSGVKTLKGAMPAIGSIEGEDTIKVVKPKVLEDLAETEIVTDVPFEIMNLKYDNSWSVVAGDEFSPYIIMKRLGSGYIFISSFALGKQPMTGWTGSKSLWESVFSKSLDGDDLIRLRDPQVAIDMQRGVGYGIFEVLSNIEEMAPPSASKLIIILIIYLLVVGPLNYIILKKMDRRELAWFTIPILVVFFSIGIYGIGNMAKGTEIVSNAISVARLWNDNENRSVNTYSGIFIPKQGDYIFSSDGGGFLLPNIESDFYYSDRPDRGQEREIVAEIVQGGEPSVKIFNAKMWTMETFSTETRIDNMGSIDGSLAYKDGKIIGTVENNTSLPLEDVVVLSSLGYCKVGNLAAGAKKNIEFEIMDYGSHDPYVASLKYVMLDDVYPMDNRNENVSSSDRLKFTRRRLLEDNFILPEEHTKTTSASGKSEASEDGDNRDGVNIEAFVFGFNNQRLVDDIEVQGKAPQKSYYTNLIMDKLHIDTEVDGKVVILPGIVKADIDEEKSRQVDRYEIYDDLSPVFLYGSKEVYFYFDMGKFNYIDMDNLTVYIKSDEGKGLNSALLAVGLYDKDGEDYIDEGEGFKIDMDTGVIEVDPAYLEKYVDDDNRLYIRVGTKGDGDRDTGVFRPTIGVEGRRR